MVLPSSRYRPALLHLFSNYRMTDLAADAGAGLTVAVIALPLAIGFGIASGGTPAQGFIAFILWGVGVFVGTWLAGRVQDHHKLASPRGAISHDWSGIRMTPTLLACGVMVVFLLFFRNPATLSTQP